MAVERALLRCLAAGILVCGTLSANEVISNGNFNSGLTGWTVFSTPNGTAGTGEPAVVPFTPPGGSTVNALQFDVGQIAASGPGDAEGGGIEQTVTTSAGILSGSVGVAEQGGSAFNLFGGAAEVLLDSQVIATYTFNSPAASQVQSATLSFQNSVLAGDHTIGLQFVRPATTDSTTPWQYGYNFTVEDEVPEPSSTVLLGFGLAVVVAMRGRTRIGRSARPRVIQAASGGLHRRQDRRCCRRSLEGIPSRCLR